MSELLNPPNVSEPIAELNQRRDMVPTRRMHRFLAEVARRLNDDFSDVASVLSRVADAENMLSDIQARQAFASAYLSDIEERVESALQSVAVAESSLARLNAVLSRANERITDLENLQ